MANSGNTSSFQDEQVRILTVKNKMGIHARPAAMIVRIANKFPNAEISIEKGNEAVNAKSIMGVMMLAAGQNARLRVRVKGESATVLLDELEALFDRQFQD